MCGISRTNHPANSAPSFLPKLLALLHTSRLLGLKNDSGPKERNPHPNSSANSNDHRSNLRLLPQTQSNQGRRRSRPRWRMEELVTIKSVILSEVTASRSDAVTQSKDLFHLSRTDQSARRSQPDT